MQKESPAQYAQRRRDRETEARKALKALLPNEVFGEDVEERRDLNITTKVLVAARTYIEGRHAAQRAATQPAKTRGSTSASSTRGRNGTTRRPDMIRPFQIPNTAPEEILSCEEVLRLRQVAQRIVHKAEDKLMVDGAMTDKFRSVLNEISDTMIDKIHRIEKKS